MRLDRPESKNAIGKEMLMRLNHHLQNISIDASVNVLLLKSCVPKVFCAGADLKVISLKWGVSILLGLTLRFASAYQKNVDLDIFSNSVASRESFDGCN